MKEIGHGWASGKIILLGEHAVVYGEPAIAFPFLGAQITATVTKAAAESTIDCLYYTGALRKAPETLKSVRALLQLLTDELQITEAFQLTITSSVPAERGMGSSAAVAVAITRSFLDWQQLPETQERVLYFVDQAEKIAHGNPSGIDAATISGKQAILFTKGQPFASFQLNLDAVLIVADTGVKGQTRLAVKDVAHLFEQDATAAAQKIQRLGAVTQAGYQAMLNNQPAVLGYNLTAAQTLLQALNVSSQKLDTLIKTALAKGALGAKLTGGGRGGCMIALADTPQQAVVIRAALEKAGAAAVWLQGLGEYAHVSWESTSVH